MENVTWNIRWNNNNNNNILYSTQQEIKAVVQSHIEDNMSIILSHETHAQFILRLAQSTILRSMWKNSWHEKHGHVATMADWSAGVVWYTEG